MKIIPVGKSEVKEGLWQRLVKEYELPPNTAVIYVSVADHSPNISGVSASIEQAPKKGIKNG